MHPDLQELSDFRELLWLSITIFTLWLLFLSDITWSLAKVSVRKNLQECQIKYIRTLLWSQNRVAFQKSCCIHLIKARSTLIHINEQRIQGINGTIQTALFKLNYFKLPPLEVRENALKNSIKGRTSFMKKTTTSTAHLQWKERNILCAFKSIHFNWVYSICLILFYSVCIKGSSFIEDTYFCT